MTFRQMAFLVLRNLAGGDIPTDFNIDEREVILYLKQMYGDYLKSIYFENIKIEGEHQIGGQFLYVFTAQVKNDSVRQESYIDLEKQYVDLPFGRGVHEVAPIRGDYNTYIPMGNGQQKLLSGTPAGNLEGNVGFYHERKQLRFDRCVSVPSVLVKIYSSDDDEVTIDSTDMINNAFNYFKLRNPQDRVNNQNASVTVDSQR